MHCTIDNCAREARYTFLWPWGTEGACCQEHVVVVQQKAKAARGRFGNVSFSNLDPDRPREISRNERVELHSARLVAESEKADAQLRASKLFEANTQLANEVRQLRARSAQLVADVQALTEQVAAAVRERDLALIAADKAREEAEEFGGAMRERETPAEGHPPHVVEGR